MLTSVFGGVVLLAAVWGYRYGAGVVLGKVLSLAAGYLCSIAFVHTLAQWLITSTRYKGVDALILAAGLCFVAGYLAVGIVYRLLRALQDDQDDVPSITSRWLGVGLATVLGVVVGGVAVWVGGMAQDVVLSKSHADALPTHWAAPEVVREKVDHVAAQFTHTVMRGVGHAEENTAQVSSGVVAQPVRASVGFRQLTRAPEFRAWLEDSQIQQMMANGDVANLMQAKKFQAVIDTPANLDALRAMQGMPDASREDVARQFAQTSATVWQKMQRIKSNPEFQRLVADPEVVQLGQAPDIAVLLQSAKMRTLLTLILSDTAEGSTKVDRVVTTDNTSVVKDTAHALDDITEPHTDAPAAHVDVIYQWKEKDGRIRFGDQPPTGAIDVKRVR